MSSDMQDALGFTWDRHAVHPLPASTPERAVWRFKRMLAEYVWDAGQLEGNPFTYPEVQTLLDGVTVGGRKLSDERQILDLAEAARELAAAVQDGTFVLAKAMSDKLNRLIARDDALDAGMFRGEGSTVTNIHVAIGEHGRYSPAPTRKGAANLRDIYARGTGYILGTLKEPSEQAMAYFLFGSYQQFYYNGNKRTSRYLASGHLMAHGIDALGIPAARRLEFNNLMSNFYWSGDGTPMFGFLADCARSTR
jgi:Fic family protein